MSPLSWAIAGSSVMAVVVLVLLGYASVRVLRRTLDLPTELQQSPGLRPWWLRCAPWGRGLSGILESVEHLKQSEFDTQSRYKILTDHVAAAVVVHQPDGSVVWCSPYTEVLTGYSLSEIYDSREDFLQSHVHEDDRETFLKAQAIVTTAEPFQYRYRFYHKSGLSLWLETRTVPIFDPVAQEYVALSITLDVTASVNNQIKIEERNRDLNEFTYMISHDLKAPIVTLRGMLELVQEECTRLKAENAAEPLSYMRKAIGRMEQLVGGILELARVSTTDRTLEPVNLGEVVREVIEDYQPQIAQSHAQVEVPVDLPWVLGTSTQLYQIFGNLVGNALKYRSPDRTPIISMTADTAHSRRRVLITVRDNGKGIPENYHEAIFKPFHRAGEQSLEGSGVGLACVKKLVEKLGGSIRVESEVGQGTAFVIEVRRAEVSGRNL